jgi:hypothetical protein
MVSRRGLEGPLHPIKRRALQGPLIRQLKAAPVVEHTLVGKIYDVSSQSFNLLLAFRSFKKLIKTLNLSKSFMLDRATIGREPSI